MNNPLIFFYINLHIRVIKFIAMKNVVTCIGCVSLSFLIASFVAGMMTLGSAFSFGEYNVFAWIVLIMYYTAPTCFAIYWWYEEIKE